MPAYSVRTFQPATEWGRGLSNLASALFSAGLVNQRNEMQAPAYEALARQRDAEARRADIEAQAAQETLDRRRNAAPAWLDAVTGSPERSAQVNAFRNDNVAAAGLEGPPVPRPEFWTPDVEQRHRRGMEAMALAAGGTGASKADDLAKAIETLVGVQRGDDLVAGRLPPTTYYQLGRKPVSEIDEGYQINPADPNFAPVATGVAQATEGLRKAQTRTEGTKQTENMAQAGAAGARADETRADTRRKQETDASAPQVVVGYDAEGNPVMGKASRYSAQATGPEPRKPGAEPKPNELKPRDVDTLVLQVLSTIPAPARSPQVNAEVISRVSGGEPVAGIIEDIAARLKPGGMFTKPSLAPRTAAPAAPRAAPAASDGVPQIRGTDDYNRLAPGTQYRDPQGNLRTKAGA